MRAPAPEMSEPSRRSRPIAVDLFCGAGGLSLGFEQAGFDLVAATEWDPIHALVHKYNFPTCETLCADIREVSSEDLINAAKRGYTRHGRSGPFPGIDVIIGGPPCQGFSVGGKRDMSDLRNELIFEFARIVEEARPRAFLLENVGGILETRFEPLRERLITQLTKAGYQLSGLEKAINAADHGVPQRRRRVLIFGTLDSANPPSLTKSQGHVTVRDAFNGLPDLRAYPELYQSDEVEIHSEDRCSSNLSKSLYAAALSGEYPDRTDKGRRRARNSKLLTNSKLTRHSAVVERRFADTELGSVESISRLYRLPWEAASRTLRAGTGADHGSHTAPRPIHPLENRVITVREAARLHGYPDWFRFHRTNWHGHRQVGNSVPPPLAKAAAVALISSLGVTTSKPRGILRLGDDRWLTSLQSISEVLATLPYPGQSQLDPAERPAA